MSLSSPPLPRLIGLVVLALMAIAPLLPFTPAYWVTLAGAIGIASLVAIGLVLLTGVGGMTSFGQAAFVGFGAYTTAVLTTRFGFSPWATLPVSAPDDRPRRARHRARHGAALRPLPAARHHRLGHQPLLSVRQPRRFSAATTASAAFRRSPSARGR